MNDEHATVVQAFRGDPDVTLPSGKGFGSAGLRIGGKIFAMLSSRGEFVVKLSRHRVDALIASGEGMDFRAGQGRRMREWVCIVASTDERWLSLAREAKEFVRLQSQQ